MSSEPALRAEGLGKAYRIYRSPQDRLKQLLWGRWRPQYEEFWALRDVDLTVGRGETLGVIGRNGAGKSTFLQLVCGTLNPSTGSVKVGGRIAAMLELGSGFNPRFTGRENVILSASILGLTAGEIKERFAAIEAFADIGAFIDQPVHSYSSGMYARLAFAVCAHVDADILIVDEILAVGDVAFQQKCMRFLHNFRRHGTLLFVSHDAHAVVRLCDRVLWLDHGTVRDYGDAREMVRRYHVAQSELMAQEASGFRAGGQLKPIVAQLLPPALAQASVLFFDPEKPGPAQGSVTVLEAGLYNEDGGEQGAAAGGEDIELRIVARADRAIAKPVIAFVLRDRLAQILFGDETQSVYGEAPPGIAAGQSFVTSFQFRLPHMASGAYAFELFLFDGATLMAHAQDATFLHIQSRHVSTGLANLAMRGVTLTQSPAELTQEAS
jgi:lipopolysaccharide transport system ATP-binding protein